MLFVIITAVLAGILSVESIPNTRCSKDKLNFSGLRKQRKDSYEDNHLYQIACKSGYIVNEEAELRCSKGKWKANVPPCAPAYCAEPPKIPYAQIEKTSTTHGSYVTYVFQHPYKLIGYPRAQCLYGEWISKPICNNGDITTNTPVTQGDITTNTPVTQDDITTNTPVTQGSCKIPEIGNGEIGILKDGYYRGIRFVKFQTGETVNHGVNVTIRCNEGFIPVNLTTLPNGDIEEVSCNDGVWSKTLQCASAKCLGEPPPMENGIAVVANNYNGYFIWYHCQNGFIKLKTGRVKCVYGTWKGQLPVCGDSRCHSNELTYPGLKLSKQEHFESRSSFKISCEEGYEKTSSRNEIRCFAGKWNVESNPCTKNHVSCNKFENSENLNVVYSNDVKVGSIATFSCVSPYTLVGNHVTRCLQNGTWNSTLPSCEASMCSTESLLLSLPEKVLPDLKNVTDKYVPYGTELQFLCGPNSFLSGSQKTKCGQQGIWEYGAVSCIQVCVLGEITPQLLVEPSKEFYSFGETITFKCPFGQKLSSEVRRVMCLGTSWSDPIPGCVEVVYR